MVKKSYSYYLKYLFINLAIQNIFFFSRDNLTRLFVHNCFFADKKKIVVLR